MLRIRCGKALRTPHTRTLPILATRYPEIYRFMYLHLLCLRRHLIFFPSPRFLWSSGSSPVWSLPVGDNNLSNVAVQLSFFFCVCCWVLGWDGMGLLALLWLLLLVLLFVSHPRFVSQFAGAGPGLPGKKRVKQFSEEKARQYKKKNDPNCTFFKFQWLFANNFFNFLKLN